MPNYQMSQLVVGGIGKHRFSIITGRQLITPVVNRSFESGLGDWSYSGNGVISRVQDDDTYFGDYCMKVQDNQAGSEEYADYTVSLTESIDNRKFAVYFWARCDSADTAHVQLYSDSSDADDKELGTTDISLTTNWKPYIAIAKANAGADGTTLYVRIKPYGSTEGNAGLGTMYVDNIQCWEISFDFWLKQATRFSQNWKESVDAEYELVSRNLKVYPSGSRYHAELYWDYLEPPEELVKHKIYAARYLLFMPHIDYNWAILCRKDGDNVRDYFHDKYIGHHGYIRLKGLELLESDPPEIPAGAGAGDMFGSGTVTMDDVIISE